MTPHAKNKSDQAWIDAGGYIDETMPHEFCKFYERFVVLTEDCYGGKAGTHAPLLDWHYSDIILPFFGHKNADGTYRFQEAIIFCGKKQSKTSLCAAISLFHVLYECRTANAYVIASTVKQAKLLFDCAEKITRYGPLKEIRRTKSDTDQPIWVHTSTKIIEYTNEDGFTATLTVLPFTLDVDGPSATLLVADEIAAWPQTHARTIWDKLDGSTMSSGGRKIIISTPQYDMETLGYSKWLKARQILDSEITVPDTLAVVYGIPDDESCICGECKDGNLEAWRCPAQWKKHNPSYGITVRPTFYAEKYAEIGVDPLAEAKFRTYFAAQWVGNSRQWVSSNLWAKCKSERTLEEFAEAKTECFIGADLSRKYDLSAVVLAFKEKDDDKIYLFGHAFLPLDGIEQKEKRDRSPYRRWRDAGWMTLIPGEIIDKKYIRRHINDLCKRFNVLEVRYDPSYFQETADDMFNEDNLPMVPVPPTTAMMHQPTLFFERAVIDDRLRHHNSPIMNKCLEACTIKITPQQMVRIDKDRSTGRIDLIIASIIACSGWVSLEQQSELFAFSL